RGDGGVDAGVAVLHGDSGEATRNVIRDRVPSGSSDGNGTMRHFEAVRSHIGSRHQLHHNDPYLISFDLKLGQDRHQGIYLADLDGSPYLHLCENRLYEFLDAPELERVIHELGSLGDQLEQVIASGDDSL